MSEMIDNCGCFHEYSGEDGPHAPDCPVRIEYERLTAEDQRKEKLLELLRWDKKTLLKKCELLTTEIRWSFDAGWRGGYKRGTDGYAPGLEEAWRKRQESTDSGSPTPKCQHHWHE